MWWRLSWRMELVFGFEVASERVDQSKGQH